MSGQTSRFADGQRAVTRYAAFSSSLLNQPKVQRITIELSFARLNRCDNDQNQVQKMQNKQKRKPDQDQAKNTGHDVVDQHRNLKIERFFSMRIDLRRIAALGQPDDERA